MITGGSNQGIGGFYLFPRQNLTTAQKISEYGSIEEWGIAMIRAIDNIVWYRGGSTTVPSIYNKQAMRENIDLVRHGIFQTDDFKRLLKPFGENVTFEFPVDLEHYPIINAKVELLRGEEKARPFNFSVINASDDALNNVQEERAQQVYAVLQETLIKLYQIEDNPDADKVQEQQKVEQEMQAKLKEIDKYLEFSYSDQLELTANALLKYFLHSQRLFDLFNRNFLTYLCTGAEIFAIEYNESEPQVRMVDPRYFDFDNPSFEDYIDDSAWCRELEYISSSEVLARYWDVLNDDQVAELERIKGMYYVYPDIDSVYEPNIEHSNSTNSSYVRVGHYEWEAMKQVLIITTTDEYGNEIKEIAPEDYKRKKGDNVEEKWIPERWQGIRIGYGNGARDANDTENGKKKIDLFIKVEPIPHQYSSIENIGRSKSRYIGLKPSFSFVDKLKKYQYLYNITMFQLKLHMARNKGRAFVMDVAQIPKTLGWTVEKWMYMLDSYGVGFINSSEEDNKGERSQFNQFTPIDRSTGDQIAFLIQQLDFIKKEMADITGVTPQREGQVSASETMGGVERSVTQSSAITEMLFAKHNECKKRVLQRVLDIAKSLYKPGKKLGYVLGNMARQVLEIPEDFSFGEFGVFVADSGDEAKLLADLKQLAQISLQQKEISLSHYIQAVRGRSTAEMLAVLEEAAKETAERGNQQYQAQQEQQQQQLAADQQKFQAEQAGKMQIEQLKANTAIEVAKINAEARIAGFRPDVDVDVNDNGVLDVIERDRLKLEQEKLAVDDRNRNRELDIKEKDIQGKKELEALKLEAERQKTGMEMEKMKADTDATIAKSQAQTQAAQQQAQANAMNPAFNQQPQQQGQEQPINK
jgi:hypothetical protein